jgi:hypothetical protein
MPRVIVTTDQVSSQLTDTPVLLSESVNSLHLNDEHAAAQLIQRLAWAIGDAEDVEGADGWDFSLTTRAGRARREQAEDGRDRVARAA